MPTAQEGTAGPANADDTYVEATKRLRELTRDDKQLLLKKNIAGLAAGLTLLTSLALLVVWLFYFDREAVRRVDSFIQSDCSNIRRRFLPRFHEARLNGRHKLIDPFTEWHNS